MRKLVRLVGQVLLSVPWFLKWPFTVWNWAARAHHVPLARREPLFSWCVAGMGILLMYAPILMLGGDIMQLVAGIAAYVGTGIPTVRTGIALSREYRQRPIQLLTGPSIGNIS